MTPQSQNWSPNSDVYARNEENMMDWEGNMIEPRHRTQIIIDDLPDAGDAMIAHAVISSFESITIDNTMATTTSDFGECMITDNSGDNVHAVLSGILATHDPVKLHNRLLERRNDGIFATSIGSTTVVANIPSLRRSSSRLCNLTVSCIAEILESTAWTLSPELSAIMQSPKSDVVVAIMLSIVLDSKE